MNDLPSQPAQYACPCGKIFTSHFALGGHKVACKRSWGELLRKIDDKWKSERELQVWSSKEGMQVVGAEEIRLTAINRCLRFRLC